VTGRGGGGSAGEGGAAVIEFVVVFLALLLPLVYVLSIMAGVQRALLATSSAAREVGRVWVTSPDVGTADSRARVAFQDVMGNFGYAPGDRNVAVEVCVGPPGCGGTFGPGAELRVRVVYRVPVARVPFFGSLAGPVLPVGATQRTRVDRYRGFGP